MKKIFVLILILFNINLFSQTNGSTQSFSNIKIGALGGINFENLSNIGGTILIEGKYNLIKNLNLNLSFGFTRTLHEQNYNVKTNAERIIDDVKYFNTVDYDVLRKDYDIFPFSIGAQYIIKRSQFSPYAILNFSYNSITTKIVQSPGIVTTYPSYELVPLEFRNKHSEILPENYLGIGLGIGALYKISKALEIDFRYLFKYDDEIVNTHNILIGVFI